MRIDQALAWAAQQLASGESPQVDARVLLTSVLGCSQTYLFTWPDKSLSDAQQRLFEDFVARRRQGEPVAYITGSRDFWSLTLNVSPATLIPRPETELLVEQALQRLPSSPSKVCDLGTGTGAIALAIASERPDCTVTGVDVVPEAVALATGNASLNHISNATFVHSRWFDALAGQTFDMLVSNPPYVETDSPYLQQGDVRFEPASALTAGSDGLEDIQHIVEQARQHLAPEGWLLLEHGFNQGAAVRHLLIQAGYQKVQTLQDLNGLDRISLGSLNTCV